MFHINLYLKSVFLFNQPPMGLDWWEGIFMFILLYRSNSLSYA